MNKTAEGLLLLFDAMLGAIFEEEPIYQPMVEKISKIIEVERVVAYLITTANNGGGVFCEIIAGTPKEDHGIGEIRPIEDHPDIMHVLETNKVENDTDPENNPNTIKFRPTIGRKKISNILYIPIILKSGKMIGVIVIDALDGRMFTPEEIEQCDYAGKMISIIINEGENFIGKMRDLFFNRIVSVGTNINRLKNFLGKIMESLDIYSDDVKKMQERFPKSNIVNNKK